MVTKCANDHGREGEGGARGREGQGGRRGKGEMEGQILSMSSNSTTGFVVNSKPQKNLMNSTLGNLKDTLTEPGENLAVNVQNFDLGSY
jgi:hypothetical protein